MFFFPIKFAFEIENNYILNQISIIFFIINLIVIMNTGYYKRLEIIENRVKILQRNIFEIIMIILTLFALIFQNFNYL